MKRNKKKGELPIWEKTSTGTLILRFPTYLRIKPKQQIACAKEDLGKYWDTDFRLVKNGTGDNKVVLEKEKKTDVDDELENEEYTIELTDDNLYNVVSKSGEVMNEEGLTEKDAKKLKKSLDTVV